MASFEDQMAELEKVVDRLEQGDLTLEENVKLFERGVQLSNVRRAASRYCWNRERAELCRWRIWRWPSRMKRTMKSLRMMSWVRTTMMAVFS
jgi:exodeoxyribonuclease VII small subunit